MTVCSKKLELKYLVFGFLTRVGNGGEIWVEEVLELSKDNEVFVLEWKFELGGEGGEGHVPKSYGERWGSLASWNLRQLNVD